MREARLAADAGADVLCVQGPEAGGHRSTFHVADTPEELPLDQLLEQVRAVTALPLIAAGGIATAERAVAMLTLGALAVQVGTPLLRTPEAGQHPHHRVAQSGRGRVARMNRATRYGAIAFSEASAARQRATGSINWYGHQMADGENLGAPEELDGATAALIRSTDSFFLATVTPSGWPYIQHGGGPPGFVHVLNPSTIALGDYSGNQQFVTLGNLDHDNRIALFFVDYPTRTRVKVFGRAEIIERTADPGLIDRMLSTPEGVVRTRCDRAFLIHVEALDRNCLKNIPVKYSSERLAESLRLARAPLTEEIEQLRRRNHELEQQIAQLQGR